MKKTITYRAGLMLLVLCSVYTHQAVAYRFTVQNDTDIEIVARLNTPNIFGFCWKNPHIRVKAHTSVVHESGGCCVNKVEIGTNNAFTLKKKVGWIPMDQSKNVPFARDCTHSTIRVRLDAEKKQHSQYLIDWY